MTAWRRSLRGGTGLAAIGLAASFAMAGSAGAAVVISSQATSNMSCSNGVCAPTAADAVLNAGDLETMLASGNVSVTTTGSGVQAKDIDVKADVSWSTGSALRLDAYQSVTIEEPVSVQGLAGLTLTTNEGGKNGMLSFAKKGDVTFANLSSSLAIDGTAYTLENSIAALAAAIAANPSGAYALANGYDAGQDGTYAASPVSTTFTGSFEGLGNTISNLTIDDPRDSYLGFFAGTSSGSRVSDVTIENASVTLKKSSLQQGGSSVGVLVGFGAAMMTGIHATGSIHVFGNMTAGGLIGVNYGPMSADDARVDIQGAKGALGGLVGHNDGTISECYADGSITGRNKLYWGGGGGLVGVQGAGSIVNSYARGTVEGTTVSGGLVGVLDEGGDISSSYSTGKVGAVFYAGGLIGEDDDQSGGISDTYWDIDTSKIKNLSQGAGNVPNDPGITGLTTEQLQSGLPQGFDPKVWGENPKINHGLPYLLADPPAGGGK